ncbi:MAG: ABC transporter ATP-binding protein [Alphaproteobacteria bacterium]|nr:ABC transporter ATP-binding protein [Alphaproteobacteria bacterium]
MSSVTLAGVTGRYGDFTALDAIDLEIAEGEFLTLLGPSGCGKTTTLRLVAGFLEPSRGRVLFDDEDVTHRPPNRRQIGMVFQDYALFPHMTIADNVGFGLRERGVGKAAIRRRVDELLDLVRLPGVQQRYPAQLSGGQRQRVALARAVAHPPRVLLMDEPLGALDLKLREAMQTEIQRIQRTLAITTVYVTHDQTEAMNLSDRIAVMNQGRIEQLATARELYLKPRTRFVADFVGKINFLPVTVDGYAGPDAHAVGLGTAFRVADGAGRPRGPCLLAVRPEQLRLSPAGTPADGCNALDGRIVDVRYSGNLVRCEVEVAGGTPVIVETGPDDPLATAGTAIRLAWAYDRCTLLDDD